MALRYAFHCVCICICIHLEELYIGFCRNVTDAGISTVIRGCSQLHVLNLMGLKHITGMCSQCEDPEPTFYFITLWSKIFLQQVRHCLQRPTTGAYFEQV
jgi:bacterioferritin-associated ferredoxin